MPAPASAKPAHGKTAASPLRPADSNAWRAAQKRRAELAGQFRGDKAAAHHVLQQRLDLAQQVTRENESYQVDNPWKAPIEAWLSAPTNHGKRITSELLLSEAICKPVERQSRADQMQVGTILRELGYEKRRTTVDGTLKWVFFQPQA